MARELYNTKPKTYPTPPLLKDYANMHKGWGTVVGYGGKVKLSVTSCGNKKQNRRRHRWICHCAKCNRYFRVSHQNLGRILRDKNADFLCSSCHR